MNILIISFSSVERDGRVLRQIKFLSQIGNITLCAFKAKYIQNVKAIDISFLPRNLIEKILTLPYLLLGNPEKYYWGLKYVRQAKEFLRGKRFDLIVANDLSALPLAIEHRDKYGGKVLFDAHEFSPAEFEDRLLWRLVYRRYATEMSRRFVPRADGMTTVSWGIARAWSEFCGVKPIVITNAPPKVDLIPSPVDSHTIRMVHHGGAVRSRALENMIQLMHLLDERFVLDLILIPGDRRYIEQLKKLAQPLGDRIQFCEPVDVSDIPYFCNKYDIGLYLMPENSLNNKFALPNKFFEFIQARIVPAIWPVSEMQDLIRRYDCGLISKEATIDSMAESLSLIDSEWIVEKKKKVDVAAKELCYESNFPRWRLLLSQMGF